MEDVEATDDWWYENEYTEDDDSDNGLDPV